jgi:nucleoid DNA-binding protein
MTWHQFIAHVAKRARLKKALTKRLLETLREELPAAARDGGLRWPGLGTFDIGARKARDVVVPPGSEHAGERIHLPRIEALRLRPAKAQKRKVRRKVSAEPPKGMSGSAENDAAAGEARRVVPADVP